MKKILLLLLFWVSYAHADVTLIIPFSPGGAYDTVGRKFSSFLETELGTPINVINVTGAGGLIAINKLTASNATTMMLTSSSFYTNILDNQLDIDQFKYISVLAESPLYLGVKKGAGITCSTITNSSKDQFLGSSGPGSISSFATSIVSSKYKHIIDVPYKGSGQMITDILSGQISGTFYNSIPERTDIEIIAATTLNPVYGIPGMKECFGIQTNLKTQFVLVANKKADVTFMKTINESAIKYTKDQAVNNHFKTQGMIATADSLDETAKEVNREYKIWAKKGKN